MSQADLARAAFGTIKDKQGRTVAKGRDSVSSYERARTFPNLKNLNKLADALKVEVADLRPNTVASVNDTDVPALELKQVPGQPDRAWLRVNRLMSLEAASKILIVVQEDEKARGNRSN